MADTSPTGLWAVYCHNWDDRGAKMEEWLVTPVTSFDTEGHALVCGEETGRLLRATDDETPYPSHIEGEVMFWVIVPWHRLADDGYRGKK